MALQGFDKSYFLPQALAQLQGMTEYADMFRGQSVTYLEEQLAANNITADELYSAWGWKYDIAPNQYFDKDFYIQSLAEWAVANNQAETVVQATSQFMESWAGKDVYQHYIQYGSALNINPSADFDEGAFIESLYEWANANASDALAGLGVTSPESLRAFFNQSNMTALGYFMDPNRIDDVSAISVPGAIPGTTFNITPVEVGDIDIMRITGDQAVRIDFTNPANQVTGLDLDGYGSIDSDGIENNITGKASGFEIVDAYARNPLNEGDKVHNYLGDIYYDGTGFAGDGVSTDGNIFLGGLGADKAFGGIGNDFMAGGGVADNKWGNDELSGGRNADFFFVELSALDSTDGLNTKFDGGTTTDDSAAGLEEADSGVNSQNNDWILVEASDDDEPVYINLALDPEEGDAHWDDITTQSGRTADLVSIESVDASGNLYGFINDINVEIGARATDLRASNAAAGTENYGFGSTAQLDINGSSAANAIIGGYDNDDIKGNAGNDILFGGNLNYLLTNRNNPNLLNATGGLDLNVNGAGTVNDGRDEIDGGADDDNILFEMDGGVVNGNIDNGTTSGDTIKRTGDTAWLTNFSMGRMEGATVADEATAQDTVLAALTTDSTVRFDLGNSGSLSYINYGGADDVPSQDQTNYVSASGVKAVEMTDIESVIATGLGAIDFKAAGTNSPELSFNNQQNFLAINADLDLRGNGVDNTLYANTGTDVIEGRTGDDNLSGGKNDDVFIFQLGDGVDIIHRQLDANGDNLWDTNALGQGLFIQDFRAPQEGDISASRLVIDFGSTDLTSPNVTVGLFNLNIGGTAFTVDYADLVAAKSAAALAEVVNEAYQAIDESVTVTALNNTLVVTDAEGRDISDTVEEGYAVGVILGNSSAETVATFYPGGTPIDIVEDDILIFKSYQNRDINLGWNETIEEIDNAAELVARFDTTGSQLAEGQKALVRLVNVNEGDKVTITINGKNYSYTAKAGEDSTAVAQKLAAVINNELDLNSGSGKITAAGSAAVNEFDDNFYADNDLDEITSDIAVLSVAQVAVGAVDEAPGSMTYMNISVSVTNSLTGSSAGSASLHNQSSTHIDLVGFDGRDGNVNGEDVLFLGRTEDSVSLLQTAKNSGETLTGMDATFDMDSTVNHYDWINGDDLLYGGDGNDTINAGTGDDRIIVTKGTDTVDGGSNSVNPDGTVKVYNDVLQAEELVFGTGTSFTVTLDGTLGTAGKGKGTLESLDAAGAVVGTTAFTNIETVRVLENSRTSTLNIETLSNNVAAAVATDEDVMIESVDTIDGKIVSEGVTVNLTRDTPSVTYTVDGANNGGQNDGNIEGIAGKYYPVSGDFNAFVATQVYGVENIVSGNANDTINIDESQITANNIIKAGSQQDNIDAREEGYDIVNYDHSSGLIIPSANLPDMTVKVESASDTDQVIMTGGILGTAVFTDTLENVEMIDVSNAAMFKTNDSLDLSSVTEGATVAFNASVPVQKSLGGASDDRDTLQEVEADTFETGGVSATGNGLGNEKVEIIGITQLEKVIGSAGDDRVIIGDADGMNSMASDVDVSIGRVTLMTTLATDKDFQNAGLYKFELGEGDNDSLDYFYAEDDIVVSVDTTYDADGNLNGKHYVLVDDTAKTDDGFVTFNDLEFNDDLNDRVDIATGVERFWASGSENAVNAIDVSASTVATTIEFSKESHVNANEVADPNGDDGDKTENIVRGAEVRSTVSSDVVFAHFMDRGNNYDKDYVNPNGQAYWNTVIGSAVLAETVILTDNEAESGVAHNMILGGGANVVDYSARTAPIVALVLDVDTAANIQSVIADGDITTVAYASYNADAPESSQKTLTVIGSGEDSDRVDISQLANNIDTYNLVDLESGIVVVDALDTTVADEQAKVIYVKNFENITGSAAIDRLYGDGSTNSINGAAGNDWIVGRGGIGNEDGDGDHLVGGDGNDRFIYETESDSATSRTNDEQTNTVRHQWDTIDDFGNGGDTIVFNTTDEGVVTELSAGALVVDNGPSAQFRIQIDQNGDGNVAGPAVDNVNDQDYSFIDMTGQIDEGDILFRVAQSDGRDLQYLDKAVNATDLQFEIVYTSADESNNLAGPDEFHNFQLNTAGGLGNGADKIDLRSFDFESFAGNQIAGDGRPAADDKNDDGISDLVQGIIYTTPVTVNSITEVENFFREGMDATGTHRAVHVQLESGDAIIGSNNFRVFVDVDRDGNYTQENDLVFDLMNVKDVDIEAANVVVDGNKAGFVNYLFNDQQADGTGNGIFIFNDAQYNFWNAEAITNYYIDGPVTAEEGSTATFTIATENVAAGELVNYTITGIDAEDVADGQLTGAVVVDENGVAVIQIDIIADEDLSEFETMTVTIDQANVDGSHASWSTDIIDAAHINYFLDGPADAEEGSVASFILTTENAEPGMEVSYHIDGINPEDVEDGNLDGTVILDDFGTAVIDIALVADADEFEAESMTVIIGDHHAEFTTNIIDLPGPVYNLDGPSETEEGTIASFILTTENVAPGTEVHYTIEGINPEDVADGNLEGTVILDAHGSAVIDVALLADADQFEDEYMTVSITDTDTFFDTHIIDVVPTEYVPVELSGNPPEFEIVAQEGVAEAFILDFAISGGTAVSSETVITITGFTPGEDILQFNDTAAIPATVEEFLDAAVVMPSVFANKTTISFFPAEAGDVGSVITLAGIVDATLGGAEPFITIV